MNDDAVTMLSSTLQEVLRDSRNKERKALERENELETRVKELETQLVQARVREEALETELVKAKTHMERETQQRGPTLDLVRSAGVGWTLGH